MLLNIYSELSVAVTISVWTWQWLYAKKPSNYAMYYFCPVCFAKQSKNLSTHLAIGVDSRLAESNNINSIYAITTCQSMTQQEGSQTCAKWMDIKFLQHHQSIMQVVK